jgi:hypothetical protein
MRRPRTWSQDWLRRDFSRAATPPCGGLAGELGFEPRQTESESVVLPLHHSPKIALRYQRLSRMTWQSCCGRTHPKQRPRKCALLPAWSPAWQALMAEIWAGKQGANPRCLFPAQLTGASRPDTNQERRSLQWRHTLNACTTKPATSSATRIVLNLISTGGNQCARLPRSRGHLDEDFVDARIPDADASRGLLG